MKKTLPIAIIAASLLGLGSLSSCHDEDFGASTAVLQERAFEQGFIKEFGKPSANQTWDFYSLQMEALRKKGAATRATQAITVEVDKNISQPDLDDNPAIKQTIETYSYSLEEYKDNSKVGQNSYTLTSTGDFKIYAVRYAGGIEVGQTYDEEFDKYYYDLDFGLAYYDDVNGDADYGGRVLVPIFGPGFKDGYSGVDRNPNYDKDDRYGNPGWAAEVKIPAGQNFHFYLRYNYPFPAGKMNNQGESISKHYQEQIFYSNESPTFIQRDGTPQTFSDYGGASVLLYSSERYDEATNMDEQIMMIGFEDAWGHGPYQGTSVGNGTKDGWFDKDFNDVIVLIEGKLPLPTAKRFFCEDKNSFDWDYNDVVFDVNNTGIVLRAVGGTLPVWLRVTDRLGNPSIVSNGDISELHELMRSLQPAPTESGEVDKRTKVITYERQDENGDTKTYYKPIDVAAWQTNHDYPGVWLDPVQIVRWTHLGTDVGNNFTRLDEATREVERFANPFVDNPVGGVELIVGSVYGQTVEQALLEAEQPDYYSEDPTGNWTNAKEYGSKSKIVKLSSIGGIPAIWSGLVANNWMREEQKITLGYPGFYGANVPVGGSEPQWWSPTNEAFLYFYKNDEKDDDAQGN